jgi:hypothetical protein
MSHRDDRSGRDPEPPGGEMSDIVERLRRHDGHLGLLVEEAADEIERLINALKEVYVTDTGLRAEIERLKAELAYCPRDMQVADGLIRDLRAENEQLRAVADAARDLARHAR